MKGSQTSRSSGVFETLSASVGIKVSEVEYLAEKSGYLHFYFAGCTRLRGESHIEAATCRRDLG